MVINIGIIGFSEGNGHPYSFSSIINGFDIEEYKKTEWSAISNYLQKKDITDFTIDGVKINAVWCPELSESKKIAKCSHIEHVCGDYHELESLCDAIIIARDDWESHYELAAFFLEKNKFVFVDKPLSLNIKELEYFSQYLETGRLMSCAALRYAIEFDALRDFYSKNEVIFTQGTIVSSWEKYGVHLLDGIFSCTDFDIKSIYLSGENTKTAILTRKDNSKIVLNCLGNSAKTFNISAYSHDSKISCEMSDNFSAFKRMLKHFVLMIQEDIKPIPANLTLNTMKTLIAGNISLKESRLVMLDEIDIK